jgi:hypothetical protein
LGGGIQDLLLDDGRGGEFGAEQTSSSLVEALWLQPHVQATLNFLSFVTYSGRCGESSI